MLSDNSAAIAVSKPAGFLGKAVTVDYKAFFKAIGKGAIKGLTGHWAEALSEIPEIVAAFGVSESAADRAWVLIRRALARSAIMLLQEYAEAHRLESPRAEPELTSSNYDTPTSFVLSSDFFIRPEASDIIPKTAPAFAEWLEKLGIPRPQATNISGRLAAYFVLAVHNEWRSNPEFYQPIKDALLSPFSPAAERELGWRRYSAFLSSQIDEPVFGESFSLRQIYIEPRGYFVQKTSSRASRQDAEFHGPESQAEEIWTVIALVPHLIEWAKKWDRDMSVRVLSGGPGAGKSSLAKIFADKAANHEHVHVILVPLYKIDTRVDLRSAIGNYVEEEGFLTENPIETAVAGDQTLLILDGLDELEMQGRGGQEVAQAFIREVIRTVDRINSHDCHLQVLISGRELAVQTVDTEFRKLGQVLHVLPYHLSEGARYRDPQELLNQDQRDTWWQKYGSLIGVPYEGIPQVLKQGEIGEVTAQPLLNYLVALSYQRGGLEFSTDTNVNLVYGDLVGAVYERAWAPRDHPTVRNLTEEAFVRLLEEVALAVWHGDGRTTTLREIEEHCKQNNVLNFFPALEQGASTGISALLLAFYFRQKGRRAEGDKTFEFTHKTFGEYLLALRILRTARQVSQMLRQAKEDPGSGWDHDQGLHRWLQVCGPTAMDTYLGDFIHRQMALRPDYASELQESLSELYRALLGRGWPMHLLFPLPRFNEQERWARNAEESLLACINFAARVTKRLTKIAWPSPTAFGESLKKMQDVRMSGQSRLIQSCLSYLDLDSCCLNQLDFYGANLSNSSMRKCSIILTVMEGANLDGADLSDALISRARLANASLNKTIINHAKFINTDIEFFAMDRSVNPEETRSVHQVDKKVWSRQFKELLAKMGAQGDPEIEWFLPRSMGKKRQSRASARVRRARQRP